MKITPINFSNLVEPHFEEYWSPRKDTSNGKIEIQRSHNLRLVQTVVNVFYASKSGDKELLTSLQLVDIPQQEDYSALNCSIHIPDLPTSRQVLMVFKQDSDADMWCRKLLEETKMMVKEAAKYQSSQEAAPEEASVEGIEAEEPEA